MRVLFLPRGLPFSKGAARAALVAVAAAFVCSFAVPNEARLEAPEDAREVHNELWRTGRACGVNAAYVLALLTQDAPPSYGELTAVVTLEDRGASLAAVAHGLQQCGVECEIVRASPADLTPERLPILVHLDQLNGNPAVGHYGVLVDYDESRDVALFIDGANGLQYEMNIDPFRRMWSGYGILVRPSGVRWALIELAAGLTAFGLAVRFLRSRR